MPDKRTRRARSALLWCVAGFIGLQLALQLAIEFRYPEFRAPVYGHKIKRLQQRVRTADAKPCTVVMLGSSRTICGFNAASLEKPLTEAMQRPVVVFNFGMHGAGPLLELLNLRRILSDGVRPDLLLVEIIPPLFAGQFPLYELDNDRVPTDRLGLRDLPLVEAYAGAVRPHLRRDWWLSALVPWYSNRFSILNTLATNLLAEQVQIEGFRRMDDSGGVAVDWEDLSPERRAKAREVARARYAPYFQAFRLGDAPCRGLRELLELCRQEKIPAALVFLPEGPEFRSWYAPDAWSAVQSFVDGLSHEFAVPVINAREWLAEEDFIDSHHQLPQGAALLTERLGREGILPLLRTTPDSPGTRPEQMTDRPDRARQ